MSENKCKRLLCIVGSLDAGGAETFLMKIYRALDKTKYQMDFLCMTLKEGFYEDEIGNLGGRVYHVKPKSKGLLTTFMSVSKLVRRHKYKHVMRVSQHSLATLDLVAAKLGGAKVLIQRSTNAYSGSKYKHILHKTFSFLPRLVPNVKIAPSTLAAEYTFGKGCINEGKAILINNAINIDSFIYNSKIRQVIREEFNIDDKLVVGHVGRFSKQKNHMLLIDIYYEIYKQRSNSVLFLVGKGELEGSVKEKIETLGLCNNVIFTGVRSDVPNLLMAMDVFVFPSLYEGMPNTVIEAQATGLPCIVSDEITKEVKITELVNFASLEDGAYEWAKKVFEYTNKNNRTNIKEEFVKSGYDIKAESKRLMEIIFAE